MSKGTLILLICLTLLLPVGIYFWVWQYYAINIPKWDDHALKAFLVDYLQATNWQQKWEALFRQHNEHRITFTRFVSLLDYTIFGQLNFKRLMLYGNLLLLGVIVLWWVVLHNNKKPFYSLLPVPFIWLTLSHYENMYWGMASIQNFGVVVFAVWTLYCCISSPRKYFLPAFLFAALACLTSGNGLFVLPIGALLLFLSKNWRRMIAWLVVSSLYLVLYFFNFHKSPATPTSGYGIGEFLKGYMYFLGSFAEAFPVQNHFSACLILGVLMFLVAVSICSTTLFRIIRDRYEFKYARLTDLFCLGVILFILGTGLIVVYSRVGFGTEGILTSRYKIYSFLLLLVAYLYVVIPIRGSFLSPYVSTIVFLNALYSVFSYHYHLVDAYNLRKFQTTQRFNWTFADTTLTKSQDTSLAGTLVEETEIFYDRWLSLFKNAAMNGQAGDTTGIKPILTTTKIQQSPEAILIENTAYNHQRLQDSGVYFILVSNHRYYLFPAFRTRNTNRKQLFFKQMYFSPGFYQAIPFSELQKDTYALGLAWVQGEKIGILMGKDSINTREVIRKKISTNW